MKNCRIENMLKILISTFPVFHHAFHAIHILNATKSADMPPISVNISIMTMLSRTKDYLGYAVVYGIKYMASRVTRCSKRKVVERWK